MDASQPVGLSLDAEQQLVIEWSDGMRRRYLVKDLRASCPCATCREKRNAPPQPANPLQLLPSGPRPDEMQIRGMSPVGNYAYAIEFNDGHDTGIYPLELLRELGAPA